MIKLQAILNSSLGTSKIGNFIVNHILCSLDATNITNGEKIKYIKILEEFVSKFVQEMDKNSMEQLKFWRQLYNLVLIREHLKKGEESVIKILKKLLAFFMIKSLIITKKLIKVGTFLTKYHIQQRIKML